MGKGRRKIIILLAAFLCLSGILGSMADAQTVQRTRDWTSFRMIAHGMGSVEEGDTMTETLEAFQASYDKGHRVFEVDLLLTEDGQLAARHDWSGKTSEKLQPDLPLENRGVPLTLDEFLDYPILGKYQPLSFGQLVGLMKRYPDIYLVTDTKETDPVNIYRQFIHMKETAESVDPALLARIIPEIYTEEMYKIVMGIYSFPHKLYSLYQTQDSDAEIADFVRSQEIRTVAMPVEDVLLHHELVKELRHMGVKIYVHAVNSALQIKLLTKMGVFGIYTDALPYLPSLFKNSPNDPDLMGIMKRTLTWSLLYIALCGVMFMGIRQWSLYSKK